MLGLAFSAGDELAALTQAACVLQTQARILRDEQAKSKLQHLQGLQQAAVQPLVAALGGSAALQRLLQAGGPIVLPPGFLPPQATPSASSASSAQQQLQPQPQPVPQVGASFLFQMHCIVVRLPRATTLLDSRYSKTMAHLTLMLKALLCCR